MNKDVKIINNILANQIQQHISDYLAQSGRIHPRYARVVQPMQTGKYNTSY